MSKNFIVENNIKLIKNQKQNQIYKFITINLKSFLNQEIKLYTIINIIKFQIDYIYKFWKNSSKCCARKIYFCI